MDEKYPMGASTSKKAPKFGLVTGHTYSVLETAHHEGMRAVKLFNPWSSDNYTGQISNEDKKDGIFTMLFAEYMDAFDSTEVAEMRLGYRSDSKRVFGTE